MTVEVLMVIDMLNDFIDEKGALFCGPAARGIIPFIQQELIRFRERGNPIIFLQDTHTEDDLEFERFPPHCVDGAWGQEIIPELSPEPGDNIVRKNRFSGFFGTRLETLLQETGADTVEVVGVCTSICVMDTVGGLADRDYHIVVPREGVADFDTKFHDFSLQRMQKIYGAKIK